MRNCPLYQLLIMVNIIFRRPHASDRIVFNRGLMENVMKDKIARFFEKVDLIYQYSVGGDSIKRLSVTQYAGIWYITIKVLKIYNGKSEEIVQYKDDYWCQV